MKSTALVLAILFTGTFQEAMAAVARMQEVAEIESDSAACVDSFEACLKVHKDVRTSKDYAGCEDACAKAKNECKYKRAGKGPAENGKQQNRFEMAKAYSLFCRASLKDSVVKK